MGAKANRKENLPQKHRRPWCLPYAKETGKREEQEQPEAMGAKANRKENLLQKHRRQRPWCLRQGTSKPKHLLQNTTQVQASQYKKHLRA